MKKLLKIVGASLAAVLVLAAVGFYTWTRMATYPAFPEAVALAETAQTERGWYVFEPDGEPRAGFIFYPGGLVDPAAYSPLMQRLSDEGVLAVIVPMPLDLAVFGIGRAGDVVEAYPDIDTWVLSGHSLGGAMAAEYTKSIPDDSTDSRFSRRTRPIPRTFLRSPRPSSPSTAVKTVSRAMSSRSRCSACLTARPWK